MAENQGIVPGTLEESGEPPKKNLDFYIKKRSGKKRDYIFNAGKMKTCPHNHLHALSTGGNWYRCEDCNWAFCITQAYVQPLHNVVVGGLLNALHFAKEFGGEALQEVLRTPKGQHEMDYHLPALPEGMTFWDAVEALDSIDVNAEDMGKVQLRQLFEKHWVSIAERKRRHTEFGEDTELGRALRSKGLMAALESPGDKVVKESVNGDRTKSVGNGAGAARQALPSGHTVPSVPRRRKGTNSKSRDSGKS